MKMVWREGGSKVSQILELTTIIASLNTYEGSFKSVKSFQMLSLRRWLNEDGWGGVKSIKSVKSVPNIRNYQYYSLF